MRLHRFFIEQKIDREGEIVLSSDTPLVHQWSRVFRFKTGTQVILLDNSGAEYVAQIVHMSKQDAKLTIVEQRENLYLPKRNVFLCVSLIKKDNFEWVLEKGTELGVTNFVPILAERSEKKNLNNERALTIIKEAAEQSGKVKLPVLHEVCTLKNAVEKFNYTSAAFDPSGKKIDVHNYFGEGSEPIVIFIGPEGGWSENDLAIFAEKEIPIVSVGQVVLRAETAAVAVSSLLLL